MAGLVTDDLGGALIPDDHSAAAARLTGPDSLKVTRGQSVILDRDGQPPHPRVKRRPLGNRPRPQDITEPDPQIEMQRRGIVELHHEARRAHAATLQPGRTRTGLGQP